MSKELSVVMPVYNEDECIAQVVEKWITMLNGLGIDFDLNVYNDGSKDQTLSVLREVEKKHSRLKVHDKSNSGHGPTILMGYRNSSAYEWIFQIDSDDELGPEKFADLWSQRSDFDFLIGSRAGRFSPLPRKIISFVSRILVWVCYGQGVWDVNSPYRLMRTSKFSDLFSKIPSNTFAPNVIVSGMACAMKMRIKEEPVPYRDRQTGEVSIKKWKLLKVAAKSFLQTVIFRFQAN